MAENDAGERSELPTGKRIQKSREEGQVARSKELNTAALLIGAGLVFSTLGSYSTSGILSLLKKSFILSRRDAFDSTLLLDAVGHSLGNAFLYISPILLLFLIIALVSPISLGGWNFSMKAIGPKFNKMSPMKGLKRMFGPNGLMELVKSVSKFALIAAFAINLLWIRFDDFMALGYGDVEDSIKQGLTILSDSFLLISLSLLMIVAIDVPFQIWNHAKQLKMTKQEVRDESKDTEGRPEVKGRIRQTQRELANRRMMEAVPNADVVITNPEHYAVALKYDEGKMNAPVVIAKGTEQIALKIREIAKAHEVPMFAAPPLARAIFYSTKIDRAIPEGLYLAVAQVLAYVFQLKAYRKGNGNKPVGVTDLPIPKDLKR